MSWTQALFNERGKWGLRGDPHLWAELQSKLSESSRPTSRREFESLLYQSLDELGVQIYTSETIQFIDRYPRSGMSGGMIALDVWRSRLVPLLLERFEVER